MKEKKLTDEEIINCFELCCVKNIDCDSCPYDKRDYCGTTNKDILELLKNQKAEIERLTGESDEMFDRHAKENLSASILIEQRNNEIAELQKQVEELENRFENKAHCNMSENCSMVQQAVKETAREICLKIIKDQPQPIQKKWVEWFNKEYGVEVE